MNSPNADNATPAHILLIEDERQIRRFVRLTLQAEQMRVSEAETGIALDVAGARDALDT